MKILHVNNVANIAWYLAQGQKSLGHQATVVIRDDTAMWPGDIVLRTRGEPLSWNAAILRHWRAFRDADVIHIHGGIWRSQVAYGMLRRLLPQSAFIVHLHGSETRMGKGLHHLGWADALVCSTPDLKRFVPRARWMPNPYPLPSDTVPPRTGGKVVMGHFPTRPAMKGTSAVVAGFREFVGGGHLKTTKEAGIEKYAGPNAELWIVERVSHEDALRAMASCDVVIDQLLSPGTYGMVSVEAMALGKVVICSLDPALYEGTPVVPASSEDLSDVLQELVTRRGQWRQMGEAGRKYVGRVHDARAVAGSFIRLYYDALNRGRWDQERASRYWRRRGRAYLGEFQSSRMEPEQYRRQEEALDRILSTLDYENFIEVGCGFGRIARHLARPGVQGMGIDLSLDQLRASREYVGRGGLGLALGDARFLPFQDGAADLIVAVEVLMHLPPESMHGALEEMARVARNYVMNLDWYEEVATGAQVRHSWVHDYSAAYEALGLSMESFPTQEGSRQSIFLAAKGRGGS